MKRVSLLSVIVCCAGGVALASTTFYYDTTGNCDGLFLNPNAQYCSQAVTKVSTPTMPDKSFVGYWAGDTKVIDAAGNLLIDGRVAQNLFQNTLSSSKMANAGFVAGDEIVVKKATTWVGQSANWYVCTSVSFQKCYENQDLVSPIAPQNCWGISSYPPSVGSYPLNTAYDYSFNSWYFPKNNEFKAASSSWSNPYPNGVTTGGTPIAGGCSNSVIGPISDNVSDGRIYPFACKKIKNNNVWVESYPVDNGDIVLSHEEPGECTYKLQCDSGYEPSNSANASVSCTGLGCKGWFDGTFSRLQNKGLTATCVESEQPLKCPDAPTSWQDGYGTVMLSSQTDTSCTYTIQCNDGQDLYQGSNQIQNSTAIETCNGDQCSDSWLNGQLNGYSCKIHCPEVSWGESNGSLGTPVPDTTNSYTTCHYPIACNDYYDLYQGDASVQTIITKIGCVNGSTSPCTSEYMNTQLSLLTCRAHCYNKSDINGNLTNHLTVTSVESWPNSNYERCRYGIGCSGNYVLNGANPHDIGAISLQDTANSINDYYQCNEPTPSCPDAPTSWQDGYGSVTESESGNSCTYTISCDTDRQQALYYGDDKQPNSTTTVICNGSACTDQWLDNKLADYSCKIDCPEVSWSEINGGLGTYGPSTLSPHTLCDYPIACNDYYDLYYLEAIESQPQETIGCTVNSTSPCTSGYMNNWLNGYTCRAHCYGVEEINAQLSGHRTVTSVEPWPNDYYDRCKYYTGCSDDYTLSGNHNWTMFADSLDHMVTSLMGAFQCNATCPRITDGYFTDIDEHLVRSDYDLSNPSQCKYRVSCDYSKYDLKDSGVVVDSPNIKSCNANNGECTPTLLSTYSCTPRCYEASDFNEMSLLSEGQHLETSSFGEIGLHCTYHLSCSSGYQPENGWSQPYEFYCNGTNQCHNWGYWNALLSLHSCTQ